MIEFDSVVIVANRPGMVGTILEFWALSRWHLTMSRNLRAPTVVPCAHSSTYWWPAGRSRAAYASKPVLHVVD